MFSGQTSRKVVDRSRSACRCATCACGSPIELADHDEPEHDGNVSALRTSAEGPGSRKLIRGSIADFTVLFTAGRQRGRNDGYAVIHHERPRSISGQFTIATLRRRAGAGLGTESTGVVMPVARYEQVPHATPDNHRNAASTFVDSKVHTSNKLLNVASQTAHQMVPSQCSQRSTMVVESRAASFPSTRKVSVRVTEHVGAASLHFARAQVAAATAALSWRREIAAR